MMDEGYAAAARQSMPILVLYGARDEIIPAKPVEALVSRLSSPYRVALYPEGWHLLLRDLQARTVWSDVAAWVADPAAPLPSGLERREPPLFAGR
jgi:alpha-beta hydrolase superfamily lysophospholipase